MAIFRVEKTKDYTVMSNYHLRDKNLTLKAKGLLSWMLSNTDGWDYSVAGIVAVMKENRDAICNALAELEDYGYLTRRKIRDGGKFDGVEYLITEIPYSENPLPVNPNTENPKQINTNITNTNTNKNSLPKGKEEQAPKYKNYGEIYTDPINSEIRVALEKYVKSLSNKHSYNPRIDTVDKFAETLRKLSSNNSELAMRIVNQSIDKGWKDLYKLKDRHSRDAVSTKFNPEKDTLAKDDSGNTVAY